MFSRLAFRGISFPQTPPSHWIRLIVEQRWNILRILREVAAHSRRTRASGMAEPSAAKIGAPEPERPV
jgi:hypothetical protein